MTYVETRLTGKVDDFDDENDDEDQVVFEDQLIAVAILGRFSPQETLWMLQRLLGDLTQRLQALFEGSTQRRPSDDRESSALFERLHWLILLCGNVLADSGQGEKPVVPSSLLFLSSNSPAEADPIILLSDSIIGLLNTISLNPSDARVMLFFLSL